MWTPVRFRVDIVLLQRNVKRSARDYHHLFVDRKWGLGWWVMWMRSCAICKALLRKFRLCDSVRCQCGWEWEGVPDHSSVVWEASRLKGWELPWQS